MPKRKSYAPKAQGEAAAATKGDEESGATAYIYKVTDLDVLLGRGGYTNHHPGNAYFRNLVRNSRHLYHKSKKFDKLSVAKQVVASIKQRGGRFLVPASGSAKGKGVFQNADESIAVAKASQALRDAVYEGQKRDAMEAGMEKPFHEVKAKGKTAAAAAATTTPKKGKGRKLPAKAAAAVARNAAAKNTMAKALLSPVLSPASAASETISPLKGAEEVAAVLVRNEEEQTDIFADAEEVEAVVVDEEEEKKNDEEKEEDPLVLEELRTQLFSLQHNMDLLAKQNHMIAISLRESEEVVKVVSQENKMLRALYGDRHDYAVDNFY